MAAGNGDGSVLLLGRRCARHTYGAAITWRPWQDAAANAILIAVSAAEANQAAVIFAANGIGAQFAVGAIHL